MLIILESASYLILSSIRVSEQIPFKVFPLCLNILLLFNLILSGTTSYLQSSHILGMWEFSECFNHCYPCAYKCNHLSFLTLLEYLDFFEYQPVYLRSIWLQIICCLIANLSSPLLSMLEKKITSSLFKVEKYLIRVSNLAVFITFRMLF